MEYDRLSYFMFLIVRPDGNAAYRRIHQEYPLNLQTNEILALASSLYNLNTLQAQLTHPDVRANRKEEIDVGCCSSFRCINASTYQIRFLDTVSGYLFVLLASNSVDSKKLQGKLEELYKTYINFVFKAPFFNSSESIEKQNPIFVKKSNQILYL